jgi:hypothetical protein
VVAVLQPPFAPSTPSAPRYPVGFHPSFDDGTPAVLILSVPYDDLGIPLLHGSPPLLCRAVEAMLVAMAAIGCPMRIQAVQDGKVRCVFLDDPRPPSPYHDWHQSLPWGIYGALAQRVGLCWGGRYDVVTGVDQVWLRPGA